MLCAYYSRECDSRKLFSGLKIERESSYEEYLNQYDVLFLNMQQILSSAGSAEQLVSYIQKTVLDDMKR